jgi:hypothetical protein
MAVRTDREDVTAQREAVTRARERFSETLLVLVDACDEPDLTDVVEESTALVKALSSRAKRPPAVDTAAWAGTISAAFRTSTRSDEFEDAVAYARAAEQDLDSAAYDLATASGADG